MNAIYRKIKFGGDILSNNKNSYKQQQQQKAECKGKELKWIKAESCSDSDRNSNFDLILETKI